MIIDNINNLDLLAVGMTTAAIGILGFIIYISDRRSITNKTFLLFSIITILYSIINYIQYHTTSDIAFWLLRFTIFLAVWHAFYFFKLFYVFPDNSAVLPKTFNLFLLPLIWFISLVTLTPFVFNQVQEISTSGRILKIENGPGIFLFGLTVISLIVAGVYSMVKKIRKAKVEERKPFEFVVIGAFMTFVLILVFDFILPAILQNSNYIVFVPIFFFPFVALTAFAIYKHHLFNIRAAAVAALTFVLTISMLIEVIFSSSTTVLVLRSSIFLLVLWASILMNKFVDTIAKQKEDLQKANEGQENLIHIINHQIKGYLAKSRNIFAELQTDDYGPLPDSVKPMIQEGLSSLTEGVGFVQQVLNGSSAESGTLVYAMNPFDFKELVTEVMKGQEGHLRSKGLSSELQIEDGDYKTRGDSVQLREAVRNLVDNSINYTPQGGLKIHLERRKGNFLFTITDTGVGIAPEDKPRLFTKGGRGRDSLKININSTGYGLAFVKAVVEAHKGRVWAESDGVGKGSTFSLELPVVK